MSEPTHSHNQTDINTVTGFVHTGSGPQNIAVGNIANFDGIIAFLNTIIPKDQADVLNKLINALKQLSLFQKRVIELKAIHNMLHELEVALATIESPIANAVRENESLNIYHIKDMWRISVLPRIRDMKHFATEEMRFLEEPRFEIIDNVIYGPRWARELVGLQMYFEESLEEKNIKVILAAASSILDSCRDHLLRIDRQLLNAVNKLEQFSDELLGGIGNGSIAN